MELSVRWLSVATSLVAHRGVIELPLRLLLLCKR